jgi:universal stress protein E
MLWRHILLALPEVESVPNHVLDRAARIARGLDAEIELFHSVYDPHLRESARPGAALQELVRARVEERQRRLERVADILREQSLDVRSSAHWDFPTFEAIIRQALRHRSSLLIVPAGRLGHAVPRTLSYTDARLIEACPCPLLLLKTAQVYSHGPIVAAVDPTPAHDKPAELDDTIVAAAQTLSHALAEAPVHLYHAVAPLGEPDTASSVDELTQLASAPERQKAHWVGRENAVRKLAARHELADQLVHVELGAVETALPVYAREARADAVVMGAVSRSYPKRALFGFTAQKVLDALDCDVLIVKPRGFPCPVSRRPRSATGKTAAPRRARVAQAR